MEITNDDKQTRIVSATNSYTDSRSGSDGPSVDSKAESSSPDGNLRPQLEQELMPLDGMSPVSMVPYNLKHFSRRVDKVAGRNLHSSTHLQTFTDPEDFELQDTGNENGNPLHGEMRVPLHPEDEANDASGVNCIREKNSASAQGEAERHTHDNLHIDKIRSLICEHCGKSFTKRGALNVHLRVHTGSKPYVCDVCNKAFSQSGDLNRHLRIHTGEKPYKCEYCSRGFSRMITRKQHQVVCKTRSKDCKSFNIRPLTCYICKLTFSTSFNLRNHLATHRQSSPIPKTLQMSKPHHSDDIVYVENGNLNSESNIDINCFTNEIEDRSESIVVNIAGETTENAPFASLNPANFSHSGSLDRDTDSRIKKGKTNSLEKVLRTPSAAPLTSSPNSNVTDPVIASATFSGKRFPNSQIQQELEMEMMTATNETTHENSAVDNGKRLRLAANVKEYHGNSVPYDVMKMSPKNEKKAKCTQCGKQFITAAALQRHTRLHEIHYRRNSRLLLSDKRVNDVELYPFTRIPNTLVQPRNEQDCDPATERAGAQVVESRQPERHRSHYPDSAISRHSKVSVDPELAPYDESAPTEYLFPMARPNTESPRRQMQQQRTNTLPLNSGGHFSATLQDKTITRGGYSDCYDEERKAIHSKRPSLLERELVLKVRLASGNDKDFIEIDLHEDELTFANLTRTCCQELVLDQERVLKIRKLPNTILRRDKDVLRLQPYQELEVVID